MYVCYVLVVAEIAEHIRPVSYAFILMHYPLNYGVADNAYTLSEHLLIPYSGVEKNDKSKDVCNFYISQLRARIEQAFGLLVSKWRIFKRPIELKLH